MNGPASLEKNTGPGELLTAPHIDAEHEAGINGDADGKRNAYRAKLVPRCIDLRVREDVGALRERQVHTVDEKK